MCGIAGILNLQGAPTPAPVLGDELRAMCHAMTHRGPDDEGLFVRPQVGLAMRRLSIIDLSGGRQPISNEDNTIHAVLNGEIYNYRELRRGLEQRGHTFRTSSDTETIVHLYEEHGERCVEHLRGMFCFAVWDEREKKLVVARDRLGIKPLYYTKQNGRLMFASEMKCLLALPSVERSVSLASLDHLMTFLYTPAKESILNGIHKLEPGHLIAAEPGREPRISRYWSLDFTPHQGDESRSLDSWSEELRAVLDEAVDMHMVSDVPVGAFLSGGLDSSSVVASMVKKSSIPVKTFSIGFREAEFNELEYARIVAKALGTQHRELIVEPASLDIVEKIAWHLDEPFGDSSSIPTYLVSQLAAQEVKVTLSGDGGDELFGGYDRYVVEGRERQRNFPLWVRRLFAAISARLPRGARGKRWLRHNSLDPSERYLDASGLFNPEEKSSLFAPAISAALAASRRLQIAEVRDQSGHQLDWLAKLRQGDINGYLPLDILTKVDRMSMAHSIEARVPLLDHKLVELAARMPPQMLIANGNTKVVFKHAMRGVLPDAILDRPKKGFAIPLGRWFRGELGPYARDLLLSERATSRGFFDRAAVQKLIDEPHPREEMGLELWTLLSFELWCRTFLDPTPRTTRTEHNARKENQVWASQATA